MILTEAVRLFLRVILEFLVELYVFYFIVTFSLERAKYWALRFFGGFAAVALCGFALAFLYVYVGETVWGRILIYLALFALSVLHIRQCFAETTKKVILCCSLAYAAQNFAYKTFLIFWCLGEQTGVVRAWTEIAYRVVYDLFFVAMVAALYFFLIRKLTRRLRESRLDFRLLTISVVVLCITVILCSAEDVFFATLSGPRENAYDVFAYFVLRETGNIFSVLCCGIVLLLIEKTIDENQLKREVEQLQYAVRQGEKQYEMSKDTIDMINVKCHDIRYKINALLAERGSITGEDVKDIQEAISIYDAKTETGNPLLNVLFTEKSLYCEQNGIRFSCMADGAKLSFMQGGDLYCLFGNMIDNALEAVTMLSDKAKRVINVVIKTHEGMVLVQEENFYEGQRAARDGLLPTTKEDKWYHGFGMRSMRMIVRKYGGEMKVNVSGGIFRLTILFPDAQNK